MEWWVIGLLLGVGAPISAAGVEAIRRWYQRRSVAGTIRRIPLLPIMEVIPGPGICAIQGHARAHATMTCPFTEDPIIGVRVKIDFVQRSSSEQDSGPLRQIVDFTEMKPFEVFDDSGVALVRGEPTVLLGLPWMQDSDQFAVDITDPWLEHKVQMEGFSNTDLVVARKVSCHVRLLRPGSPVYCGMPRRVRYPCRRARISLFSSMVKPSTLYSCLALGPSTAPASTVLLSRSCSAATEGRRLLPLCWDRAATSP